MTINWDEVLRDECEADAGIEFRGTLHEFMFHGFEDEPCKTCDHSEVDLCPHGIPKGETCVDCRDEQENDPDYNRDFGFPR